MMTPQQMEDAERHAALMAVAHSLNGDEQMTLLRDVGNRWPHLHGATVADVLDYTTDYDEFLGQTELFFERFADQLPDTGLRGYATITAVHAIILLGLELTPARVACFLQRAGVIEAPRYPEVEVGLWVDAVPHAPGRDANHLLLMARAEQGLRAYGVPEDEITEFRTTVRRHDIPGFSRNVADIAAWVTLVDRYTELPCRVYDPTDDIAVILSWLTMHGVDAPVRPAMSNLRSHFDMRAPETIKASLLSFFGRDPE
jgi:hypothetical protein